MPLVSWLLVVTVLSPLPVLKSSSHAFSGAPSWRCSGTQKPLAESTAMQLGHPAGVRNSGVVLALRVGILRAGGASGPRPSSSTPFLGCAKAEPAARPAPMPIPARNCLLSILPSQIPKAARERPAFFFETLAPDRRPNQI